MKSLALLHKIFEGQVERAPNNIALIIGNKAINYNELNEKSNQLANLIRARININVGNYIALCLDRDEWMIIAILAVLKAGGTYVPIDPNYPAERIKYILSETDSQLILTNSRCVKILREFKSNILNLDNESSHINSYCRNNLIDIYTNNNDPLSYVVFTSGTTGKPKGVMVQHSGVVNLVTQSFSHYNINYKDQPCSFLFFSNYVFDVHAWEIFSCLLFGNKLYLAQDIIRYDLQLLSDFIEENNITYGLVTPAILNTKNLLKFNTLLVAGDRISQNIIEYYLKNNITIINAYGPTEASILSSMHMYKHHDLPNNIGKPIANIQYYVLNEDGQQVFIGESGELYISGKGVASGYLNQPELTNKIFVNNPFQINGNKIYKTGDIVRVMENGEYEFIGRNDSQIKLRGYRIELGEIESAINQYPEVSQSIVQLSQSGYTSSSAEKFIVGYYVANKPIPYGKLINHLEKILPVYMLPTALVHLEKLPLNHNGKVDKCSLPQPSLSDEKSHKTASSEIETTITLLWSKILNIPTKEISTNQKFYRLGGNSILAVSLLSQLNDKFHCNLNIIDIFNYSTIEELAKSIEAKASITKAKQVLNNDIYDGITASELIILRDYYHTEYKNIYNESFVVEFDGLINERTIRESLLMLVNNYEILRVNYINEDGKFTRTLRNSVDLSFLYHDFSDKNISENTFELIISKEVSREFNIENGSLIRFYFYHMGNKKSRLLIVFFHAILDGTSIINILLPDLAIKLFSENQSKLKLATNSLLDFDKVGSRLELYYSSVEAESLRYWKYFFNKYEPCKINNKIGDEKNSIGKQLTFKINADIKQRLISVANHEDISLFDVLLGAFYILLMKFCNQKSIAIRTNIDERIYCPEYLNVPGCLINNIFIGISIEKDWCIRDLLQAVKEEKSIALSHPVKFNSLLKDFRDNVIALSGVHFNIEPETNSNLPYKQSQIYTHSGQVKNNLYFELDVKPDEILGRVEFKTTLFSEDFIDSLIKSYNTILINIENQLFCKVDDACLVSVEKFKYTVNDHKNMNFSPLSDASIIKIFEDQCNKFPNRVAVDCAGRKLSYSELNVLSNQLAHYLRNHCEVQTEELVGLCFDRNEQSLIALLGVLKAGAAYVPMDPKTPDERLKYIISDTNMKLLLSQTEYQTRLEGLMEEGEVLPIDASEVQYAVAEQSAKNLQLSIAGSNLAYVIYTSGTTGKPKGVLQTHQNVVRLFSATKDWYQFTEEDVWILAHSYVFDFSVWEIWGALLHGGELIIPSFDETRDLNLFYSLCHKAGVSVLNQTPSMFYQFIDIALQQQEELTTLRYVIFGGEALNLSQLRPWFNHYGYDKPQLINMYGITETTVHVTYKLLTKEDIEHGVSCIGEVIPDQRIYVLDTSLNQLPIGAIGELYVGGAGLARGYLNRAELTAERFIPNPYQTEEEKRLDINTRLYKSGDLARILPNGNLEYIGRNDFQVKVRGYRVELGEIESVLSQHNQIKQTAVLAKEHLSGGTYLVAYYVSEQEIAVSELQSYLSTKLPDYMVPAIYIHLEAFPLTINGKLDKNSLPEPSFIQSTDYVAPRTELEKQVCLIWAELLGASIDKLSIKEDFFSLGGDSIISIQLVSRLRQRLGLTVSVKDVFACKTIERLYDQVISKCSAVTPALQNTESGILSGHVDLLPIGEWFFEVDKVDIHHWNQALMVKVPPLSIPQLEVSLNKLLEHHDALRLRYKMEDGSMRQYYTDAVDVPEVLHQDVSLLSEEALYELLTKWQSSFDLEKGPLLNVGYLTGYADGSTRLHLSFHHLVVDAVSWRILIEDLHCLYEGKELGTKGSSYRQWVNAVRSYGTTHSEERVYWDKVLSNYQTDQKWMITTDKKSSVCFSLSKSETEQLLSGIHHVYQSQINDVLLTGLSHALYLLSGNKTNHIILEGHGREDIDDSLDITGTVGWFTTFYPVCLNAEVSEIETLKYLKDELRKIPNKGIGYGSLYGYHTDLLPRISFNYLGQFEGSNNDQLWSLTNEAVGVQVSPNYNSPLLLNINGLVIDGKLEFNIDGILTADLIDKFAKHYKSCLLELVSILSKIKRSYLTASDVDFIIDQSYLDEVQEKNEVEAVYLANSLQQGFIYHALTQGQVDNAYRVQISWEYRNHINITKLKNAWELMQNRFPSLRLRFVWNDQILQVIDKKSQLSWQYIDLSFMSTSEQTKQYDVIRLKDENLAYHLSESGLFRVYLIKYSEDRYTCIFNNHHSILDGWSVQILLAELHNVYMSLLNGVHRVTGAELTYGEAQKYLQFHDENSRYWLNYIQQITTRPQLEVLLKSNLSGININEYRRILQPKKRRFLLEKKIFLAIKLLGQKYAVTPNAVLQYAWHKMLNVYGGSQQTISGVVVSGRNLPIDNIENSVGMYINTLPIIVNHGKHDSVINVIQHLQLDINEANSRSNINLTNLQDKGERLFCNLFVYENFPEASNYTKEININFFPTSTKFDYPLGIVCEESEEGIWLELRYAGELFDDLIIEQLLSFIELIVKQVIDSPQALEKSLLLVSDLEYKNLAFEKTNGIMDFKELTLSKLFALQVLKTPNNIALSFKKKNYTYRELNQAVIQLAHFLKSEYGIKRGDVVATCLTRSHTPAIAMLAIFKLGAVYLPVDTEYPLDRKQYIFEEANVRLVLASQAQNWFGDTLLLDDDLIQEKILKFPNDDFDIEINSLDLAYIIYTSGTTGRPKGIMIEHKSIVSRLLYLKSENTITEKMICGAKIPFVFDPSIRELFLPLISGARIIMFSDEEYKDVAQIAKLCLQEKINFLIFVPSHLALFVEYIETMQLCEQEKFCLKIIYSCGEVLSPLLAQKLFNIFPNIIIKNQYGPSEACQFSFECKVTKDKLLLNNKISLGKIVDDMQAYILGHNQELLPKGVIGELYLGGSGLARGYVKNPELTNKSFIPHPFHSGEFIYKTGDLVRWYDHDILEYIGRNDFQVKVRGHRIELGEIESQLLSINKIKQATVIFKDEMLIAYYVADNRLETNLLSQHLSKVLPEYMMPSVFMHLKEFPLTINGKLDRKKLPEARVEFSTNFSPPITDLEKKVCRIYQEILNLQENKVGLLDDFFYLGGNSILFIKLVNRLRKEVNLEIDNLDIFRYKKVNELVNFLSITQKSLQGTEVEF